MATIQGIYIALFGRPADPAGLAFFNEATNDGADLTAIGDLASTAEYQDRFTGMSNEEIVQSIYQSLFERDGEAEGVAFFVAGLEDGTFTINDIAIRILDGAQGADLDTVNAKIAAANLFTERLDLDEEVEAYNGMDAAQVGRDYIDSIDTNNPGTPANADAAILLLFPSEGQTPGGGGGSIDHEATGTLVVIGNAEEGGILTADLQNPVDANGWVSTAYQWQVLTADGWEDLAGETDATLTIPSDQYPVGATVRVIATTTDARGGTTDFMSAEFEIVNVEDEATGSLAIDGDVEEGGTLTAKFTGLEDQDNDGSGVPLDIEYQWQVQTGPDTWANIVGATGETFNVPDTQELVGETVRVIATTTDVFGGTTEFASDGATIENVNDTPVWTSTGPVSINVNEGATGDLVTLGATDDDGALNTLSYSITSGNGGGHFEIAADGDGNAILTVASAIDFDKYQNFTLTLQVDDGAGAVATREIAINVNNVAETYVVAPSGDDVTISHWLIDDIIQVDRPAAADIGDLIGGFEYVELTGTYVDLAAALVAVDEATKLPIKTVFTPYESGDNDVVVAAYDNGNGGTNLLVGIDAEAEYVPFVTSDGALYNDRYVIIENVGLDDISKANFDLI